MLYTSRTFEEVQGLSGHNTAFVYIPPENATLHVEREQYMRAQARWARDNFDGRRGGTHTVDLIDALQYRLSGGYSSDRHPHDERYRREDDGEFHARQQLHFADIPGDERRQQRLQRHCVEE